MAPWANGTVALLRFENNVNDEVGDHVWVNNGPAPFDAVNFAEGAFSIGPFAGAERVTQAALTGGIRTYEHYYLSTFGAAAIAYLLHATGGAGGNDVIIFTPGGNNIRFAVGGVFSGTYTFPVVLIFYHIALTIANPGGSTMYVDNVSRLTTASTNVGTGKKHTLGNDNGAATPATTRRLDYFRASNVVQPGPFPTVDPAAGGTLKPMKLW